MTNITKLSVTVLILVAQMVLGQPTAPGPTSTMFPAKELPVGPIPPAALGSVERGYLLPADQSKSLHRSGDYIRLVWQNKNSAEGITTQLFRSVTAINREATPFVLIHSFPPPTLSNGTFTFFTDTEPTNNAKNCYVVVVSDGTTTPRSSAPSCVYTLDATSDANGDRSIPKGVARAQISFTIATIADSATEGPVTVSLSPSDGVAGGFNLTYIDSTTHDFQLGSTGVFDLMLDGLNDVADVGGIRITSAGDNLRISSVELRLNNTTVFTRQYPMPVLVSNSHLLGGTALTVSFNELRSQPLWGAQYAANQQRFLGFTAADFKSKLDSVLAHAVMSAPGSDRRRLRLKDGSTTSVTRRFQDKVSVVQKIQADAGSGVDCTLSYDLFIRARDGNGNRVPFDGSGDTIASTAIEMGPNPRARCSGGLLTNIGSALISIFPNIGNPLDNAAAELEKALKNLGATHISTQPRAGHHFCFPGNTEGIAGAEYRNGGLTLCENL